jgi:hypothetical protein
MAFEGFSRLSATARFKPKSWSTLLTVVVVVGLAGSATLFAVLPAQSAFPLYTMFPQYLPSSMVQSSLPSSDYASVVNAMVWLNGHTNSDSAVITQQAFYGWAREYLSSGWTILNSNLDSPTSMLAQAGPYAHVFTVWWVQGTGWFQGSFPAGASPVASFGDLVVYQYR